MPSVSWVSIEISSCGGGGGERVEIGIVLGEDDNLDIVNATHVPPMVPLMLVEKSGKHKCGFKLVVTQT